jgi:4-hydroxybenzoyl-CoA thioesterase
LGNSLSFMSINHTVYAGDFRIYYEDTDAGGVVYHTNYLKFMERARSDWLRTLGFDQNALLADGVQLVVHSLDIRFLQPARLDDCIRVTVNTPKLSACAMQFLQWIYRASEPIAKANVKIACLNYGAERVSKIPLDLRMALMKEGSER